MFPRDRQSQVHMLRARTVQAIMHIPLKAKLGKKRLANAQRVAFLLPCTHVACIVSCHASPLSCMHVPA